MQHLIIYFILIIFLIPFINSIRCFECSSLATEGDRICSKYVGTSCSYGFFGCVKVATYVGNFIDDPSAIVSVVRGCNILPLGGVDACQQQAFAILIIVMEQNKIILE
uniref:Saposin B-type domain-containing protein n=1 Tax=Meloidogyne hapla TaxID=6305 RepID=A0A1I8BCL6_MELHA